MQETKYLFSQQNGANVLEYDKLLSKVVPLYSMYIDAYFWWCYAVR